MRLIGRLTPVHDLSATRRDEMFALFARHYEGVKRRQFAADLAEKQSVIEVVDPVHDTLRGFSTQLVLHVPVHGRTVRALFSGDTIVDREFWGDPALSHVWGHLALSLIDKYGDEPLYWYLISKGYRTYRFLPVFFHEFYPRYDSTTPPEILSVIHGLGRWKFGNDYDAATGIVRPSEACRLRSGLGETTAARLRDPHLRFFFEKNPGHLVGRELCCIAPLSRENFTAAAWRVIGECAEPSNFDQDRLLLKGPEGRQAMARPVTAGKKIEL
jgi:hypothetical protein